MTRSSGLPLQTPRLPLRPYRPGDAPAVSALYSDPVAMRYWSTPPWTSIEQAHRLIEGDAEARATGRHLRLGIERAGDGLLIGRCTLFSWVPSCRRAELGCGLGPVPGPPGLCAGGPASSALDVAGETPDSVPSGLLRSDWQTGCEVTG